MRGRCLLAACLVTLVAASPTWLATTGSALVTSFPALGHVLPGGTLEVAVYPWNANGTFLGPGCLFVEAQVQPSAPDRHGPNDRASVCSTLRAGQATTTLDLRDATSAVVVSFHNGTGRMEERAVVHAAWGTRARLYVTTNGDAAHPTVYVERVAAVPVEHSTLWLVAAQGTGVVLALAALTLRLRARWVWWPLAVAWVLMPAASPDGPDAHVPFWFLVAATVLALVAALRRTPTLPPPAAPAATVEGKNVQGPPASPP
ncbi:MAG: hypothetical protein QOI63_905 [Thermoplasmata archaeon]|jgi:hypothetical protein|nr:hypothetical protein [Thermoplasmata archaeon]